MTFLLLLFCLLFLLLLLLLLFFLETEFLCIPGCPILELDLCNQAGLKLRDLLTPPPEHWD